jgi:O-antigen/teichoic acid export membrane protein
LSFSSKSTATVRARFRPAELSQLGLSIGAQGWALASKFLLLLLLARLFAPMDLAVYGLLVSALAMSVYLLGLEYHYFTRRELVVAGSRRAAVIRDQFVVHAITLGVMLPVLAILFTTGLLSVLPAHMYGWFFALTVTELFAQEAGQTLVALSRPFQANLVQLVRSGVWVYPVAGLAIANASNRHLATLVLPAWLVSGAASLLLAAWFLRDLDWRAAKRTPVDWGGMRTGLRTAAPFIVTTGSSMGVLFLDRFIIEAYQPLDELAVYTFFSGVTTALNTLVASGVAVIRLPRLIAAGADPRPSKFRSEFRSMLLIVTVGALSLAPVLAIGIYPVMNFVNKTIFRDRLVVFFVLLGATVIRAVADAPVFGLYALRRDRAFLTLYLSSFGLSLALNLILVPWISIEGAAITSAVVSAVILVLGWALLAAVLRSKSSKGTSRTYGMASQSVQPDSAHFNRP